MYHTARRIRGDGDVTMQDSVEDDEKAYHVCVFVRSGTHRVDSMVAYVDGDVCDCGYGPNWITCQEKALACTHIPVWRLSSKVGPIMGRKMAHETAQSLVSGTRGWAAKDMKARWFQEHLVELQ